MAALLSSAVEIGEQKGERGGGMEELDAALAHRISSVLGWLELGNAREALAELQQIPAEFADRPELLEVRWTLHAAQRDWEQALGAAQRLVDLSPEDPVGWLHRAYALRRTDSGSLSAAWNALHPALDRFPHVACIPYNLACYACQMEQAEEAKRLLRRAMFVGKEPEIKAMALADADLEPLWKEIEEW